MNIDSIENSHLIPFNIAVTDMIQILVLLLLILKLIIQMMLMTILFE